MLEQVTSEATDSALYAVPHRPTSPGTAEGEKQRALSSLVDLEKEMKTIQEVGGTQGGNKCKISLEYCQKLRQKCKFCYKLSAFFLKKKAEISI